MASNLSTIGLDTGSPDVLVGLVNRLAVEARERLATAAGDYAIWRSRSGAEVWFHVTPGTAQTEPGGDREIVGLTPFYEGKGEARLLVSHAVHRADDNPFEGAFYAWVGPDDDGAGAYPIVFDAVDFAAHLEREWPAERRVRLTGFAREVKAYASEDDFIAAQSEGPGFAPQSFFPVGLFAAADGNEAASPSSHALLAGRVAETAEYVNEATGQRYLWLLVDGLEAQFDVVAAPDVVSGSIVPGGTVQVHCWMFGRLID
ncbi:MAG: hypothetical protein NW205_02625 [Hyphomicrobiaceae bacterium]|nr:hypothetical protein [Hyphomicrobiaceae bacterium]